MAALHGCFDSREKGLPFFFTFTSPFAIFLAVDQLSSLYERDFEVACRTRVRCERCFHYATPELVIQSETESVVVSLVASATAVLDVNSYHSFPLPKNCDFPSFLSFLPLRVRQYDD